jgi:hypothetical protein
MSGPCNAMKPDQSLGQHLCLCRNTSGHDDGHECECGHKWLGPSPCRFGYIEYDGDQYCFEHGGFRCHVVGGRCSKHPAVTQ